MIIMTASTQFAPEATGTPVLDTLARMTGGTFEESGLDEETFMLLRIAAFVAMGAAPASYLLNLGIAGEAGVSPEKIRGLLVALAPVVGSARIVSAASSMEKAFGYALIAEEDAG